MAGLGRQQETSPLRSAQELSRTHTAVGSCLVLRLLRYGDTENEWTR